MAKTVNRIALYTKKVEKLIDKGLITEADIIDATIKAEYTKNKDKIK